MDLATILEKVKVAVRTTTTDEGLEDELTDLIQACLLDLQTAGVVIPATIDTLVLQAVKTYCRMHFGAPADYDKLKASYDEQKAQLSMRTGYTKWVD